MNDTNDTIYFLITVTALVPQEELDPDDRAVPGQYVVKIDPEEVDRERPLAEGQTFEEEAALDEFHDQIGIEVLDHFEIVSAIVARDAIPEHAHWL